MQKCCRFKQTHARTLPLSLPRGCDRKGEELICTLNPLTFNGNIAQAVATCGRENGGKTVTDLKLGSLLEESTSVQTEGSVVVLLWRHLRLKFPLGHKFLDDMRSHDSSPDGPGYVPLVWSLQGSAEAGPEGNSPAPDVLSIWYSKCGEAMKLLH